MGVKTYQAYTAAEALAAAKRDLGDDAVILETRTFKRGGFLGLGCKNIFELTATSGDRAEIGGRIRPNRVRPLGGGAARVAYTRSAATPASGSSLAAASLGSGAAAVRTEPARPTLPGPGRVAPDPAGSPETPAAATTAAAPLPGAGPSRPADPPVLPDPPAPAQRVARRFILTPADASPAAPVSAPPSPSLPLASPAPPAAETAVWPSRTRSRRGAGLDQAEMHEELAAIRNMVGQVLQQQTLSRGSAAPSMPEKLFELYLELVGQDLSEELADRIINVVRDELSGDDWDDEAAVREAVLKQLARYVPTADPPIPDRSPDGRPLTVALIGPTGVGKTTTLAKLAASFKFRHQRKVGLVTCDTYRIAAVDQLRTYAGIMGLPLEVALTPGEMKQAVRSLHGCDVILIDTAGRGANDAGRLDELEQCLAAVEPHQVHLVLSSTSSERVLLQEAEAFSEVGADRILLTKLDEAVSFGVLVNVIQKVGKKLSFITTGQEVPDHIEAGESGRLAALVLGAEV